MRKTIIAFGVVIIILFGGVLFIQNVNLNRIGANEYYTQIIGQGNKQEYKTSGGQIYENYEYELPAYDEGGNQKTLTFTASKQLRENAYLRLFSKDEKGVTSYQEVTAEELPEKAAEMLK